MTASYAQAKSQRIALRRAVVLRRAGVTLTLVNEPVESWAERVDIPLVSTIRRQPQDSAPEVGAYTAGSGPVRCSDSDAAAALPGSSPDLRPIEQ